MDAARASSTSATETIREFGATSEQIGGIVEDGARRTHEGSETVSQARDAFVGLGASVSDMTDQIDAIPGAGRVAPGARRALQAL